MTNKHIESSGSKAKRTLLGALRNPARKVAHELLGTTAASKLHIDAPGTGTDKEHAQWVAERHDAIVREHDAPGGALADPDLRLGDLDRDRLGQRTPAVVSNPAATLHDPDGRHVEVVNTPHRVVPIVATPEGEGFSPSRGGADVTADGKWYYKINTERAVIGTADQVRGFFAARAEGKIALPQRGIALCVQVSPFVRLAEGKQWTIYDPQTQIIAYFAKSLGGFALGVGLGQVDIPGGSLPLADLPDFFENIRQTAKKDKKRADELKAWADGMDLLVRLSPHALPNEGGKYVVQKTMKMTQDKFDGEWLNCVRIGIVGDAVEEMLATLRAQFN